MTDEEQLREYMQTKYKSLNPKRSTASYALEFLKTADANAELNAAKYQTLLALYQTLRDFNNLQTILDRTIFWSEKVEKLLKIGNNTND